MSGAVPTVAVDGELQKLLDEALARHGVVGASLAVLRDGKVAAAASGMLNVDSGVRVRPESPFQIGSISKLFTATLAMQLVEEGRLDLDAPVRRYLPDFALADAAAASRITTRQLLNHSSGMEGDFFPQDDPWGASADSYVRKMALLPQLHDVGAYMCYCNSGFVLAGRVIEVLAGKPWQQLVMERICTPLGMRQAFADPREALRYLSAVGHMADPASPSRLSVSPLTYLPLSMAAAGSVLSMSAADLLRFVAAHLRGGVSEAGRRVLSEASTAAMRASQMRLPALRAGFDRMGLGWFIGKLADEEIVGHDGACAGQFAYTLSVPRHDFAYALLTNSPSAAMADELRSTLLRPIGVTAQDPPPQPPPDWTPLRYVGTYENLAARLLIAGRPGGLALKIVPRQPGLVQHQQAELVPHSPDCFDILSDNPMLQGRVTFVGETDGRAQFAAVGVRMARRVS
ncbi:beta-lactamase family protein [Sinimarinibacterium sp. CAU 1509]|uniref:serine hydrolase domain-containing protein n=1 Tax=Sinimarinibacterium sp. CAU 1509 TaxID=2562283 RepID=UPI0010AC063E|nr:serine hydrolase domain-containing protein [Sinimarinibacterium sp. CAU 1509]TJY55405.1 beta-lactamase family protein [Sinimarinibacterium sp. CAU 1509]